MIVGRNWQNVKILERYVKGSNHCQFLHQFMCKRMKKGIQVEEPAFPRATWIEVKKEKGTVIAMHSELLKAFDSLSQIDVR